MIKSKVLETIHDTITDFYESGVADEKTMRKFDALCLPKVKEFTPAQIARLRKKNKASQAVFAHYLNTSSTTVQNWEQGQKKPGRMALKLLNMVDLHGIGLLSAPKVSYTDGSSDRAG